MHSYLWYFLLVVSSIQRNFKAKLWHYQSRPRIFWSSNQIKYQKAIKNKKISVYLQLSVKHDESIIIIIILLPSTFLTPAIWLGWCRSTIIEEGLT